jgi:hypothetical protein
MQTLMETIPTLREESTPQEPTLEAKKPEQAKSSERKNRPPEEPPVLPSALVEKLKTLSIPEQTFLLLEEIEKALAPRPPLYKLFWDLRRHLLSLSKDPYFTENKTFWDRLHGLTQEARRLKEVLAEESAFAQEQIDLAIQAIEKDLDEQEIPAYPFDANALEGIIPLSQNVHFYLEAQGELILLNAYASRVNSLRKELAKLPLRMKAKNALFDRLSALGDKIFPRRKELIQEVSEKFSSDIQEYVKSVQPSRLSPRDFGFVKNSIKTLQSLAKSLTLNTLAFNQTREILSHLWDLLKGAEKEKYAERDAEIEESKKLLEGLVAQGTAIIDEWKGGNKTIQEAEKQLEELQGQARRTRLDRHHVKEWKDRFVSLRFPLDQELDKVAAEKRSLDEKREQERAEKITLFKNEVKKIAEGKNETALEQLEIDLANINQRLSTIGLTKNEKIDVDKDIRNIRESLRIRKEEALLTLSSDDKLKLDSLKEVLTNRLQRKKEIRDRLEELRKAKGSTGFDFEQALLLETQIQEERQALEEINDSIETIEEAIESLCK